VIYPHTRDVTMSNDDNIYKSNDNSRIREELSEDLKKNLEKFKDPVILGELVYKLVEERENTNRILKNLMAKIETLEAKIAGTQSTVKEIHEEVLLPQIDEEILAHIREKGKATAEDVRAKFNYKGTNAASARLNRLFELGLLDKRQVGKKVFFLPKS